MAEKKKRSRGPARRVAWEFVGTSIVGGHYDEHGRFIPDNKKKAAQALAEQARIDALHNETEVKDAELRALAAEQVRISALRDRNFRAEIAAGNFSASEDRPQALDPHEINKHGAGDAAKVEEKPFPLKEYLEQNVLRETKLRAYTDEMNEAAKACAPAADYFGLPLEVVTETLAGLRARATRETTSRGQSTALAPSAAEGLQWPSEKWKRSPEALSRKQHAVVRFLERVWRPFLDDCGFPVTRAMVAERDGELGNAVAAYVKLNALPENIRIVRTRDLKRMAERPAVA
jgi:hypothetical protein